MGGRLLWLVVVLSVLTPGCVEKGAAPTVGVVAEARLYYNGTAGIDPAEGIAGLGAVGDVHALTPTHHVVRPEAGVAVSLIQRSPVDWTLDLHVVEYLEPGAAPDEVDAADSAARERLAVVAAETVPVFEAVSGWRHDGVGPTQSYALS